MNLMKFRYLTPLLHLLVLLGVTPVTNAQVADGSICKSSCEADKGPCRSGAESNAIYVAAAALALGLDQPKVFANPSNLDNKRDMQDVLDARRRATDEGKIVRREVEDKCNRAYLQCIGACALAPTNSTSP